MAGQHLRGNLVELGGRAARRGVPYHRAQRLGNYRAGGGHRLDLGFGLQLDHLSCPSANTILGMDIYAIPAVPLYTKPVNVNLVEASNGSDPHGQALASQHGSA
ncbi:MAG: hypothetical protein ABWY39_02475 [Mycobacterium sp.]